MWSLFLHLFKRHLVDNLLGSLALGLILSIVVVYKTLTGPFENTVHTLSHRLGRNMLVLPSGLPVIDFYKKEFGDHTMPEDYPDRLRNSRLRQHISRIQARLYGSLMLGDREVVVAGAAGYAGVPAVSEDLKEILKSSGNKRLVLNDVTLGRFRWTDGITEDLDVLLSLGDAQRVLERDGINSMRLSGCWCKIDVTQLARDVENLLPGTRAITLKRVLKAQKGVLDVVKRYALILWVVILALVVAIVSLIVGSQFRGFTREAGLLLAIGISPLSIMGGFLSNAIFVGSLGGILGFLTGNGLGRWVLPDMVGLQLSGSYGDLFLTVLLGLSVCITVTLLLAYNLMKMDPYEVLREDEQ